MTTRTEELEAVQKAVVVRLPVEEAFTLFTDRIAEWWPVESKSIGGAGVTVVVDPAAQRVYEQLADGTKHDWADIAVWEPPTRIVLDWRVTPDSEGTEVEVRFHAEGDTTRVEVEHRGWERVAGDAAAARSSYCEGWTDVLGRYAAVAD